MSQIQDTYKLLKKHYSKNSSRGWIQSNRSIWPLSHNFQPQQFEIVVGALLTQNTNWGNVEKALKNLAEANVKSAETISNIKITKLEKLIRPSGFYKQKAKRLKLLAKFVSENPAFSREQLLELNGIGRETADSILNYAYDEPVFVIDAYTRRIFSRLGIISGEEEYDEIRQLFEKSLKKNPKFFQEFHALIVEHAKVHCRKQPICMGCPLLENCAYGNMRGEGFEPSRRAIPQQIS